MSARHSDVFIDQKKDMCSAKERDIFLSHLLLELDLFSEARILDDLLKKAIFASSAWKFGKCCPVVDREVWRSSPEVAI